MQGFGRVRPERAEPELVLQECVFSFLRDKPEDDAPTHTKPFMRRCLGDQQEKYQGIGMSKIKKGDDLFMMIQGTQKAERGCLNILLDSIFCITLLIIKPCLLASPKESEGAVSDRGYL